MARWQKKYQGHSVLAVGERMHILLNCVHITSADNPVPQQCEKMVLKKYNDLKGKQVNERNITIRKN